MNKDIFNDTYIKPVMPAKRLVGVGTAYQEMIFVQPGTYTYVVVAVLL